MRWRSNQLSYPDDSLGQARMFLLLDPTLPSGSTLVSSIRGGGEHLCWHYLERFMLTRRILDGYSENQIFKKYLFRRIGEESTDLNIAYNNDLYEINSDINV